MVSPHSSRHPSMTSLSQELDGIYKNYARKSGDSSLTHSLDSSTNEPAMVLHRDVPQLGSGTLQSSSSFDFLVPDRRHQATNSSLNVLLDTPGETRHHFISQASLADSSRSLDPLTEIVNGGNATDDSLGSYGNYDEKLNDREWAKKGAAIAQTSSLKGNTVIRRTVEDFEFGKDLGEGSYSTVVLAKDKITGVQYAVKILDKRHIIKEKKVKYVNIEKHALNRLSQTQGVISLFFTFQDKNSLYYVLDYAANGELLGLIKKYGTLNEDCTKYLGAQILDAIHHMHINGVIHRDIKPENILLDDKFRIRITDFGTAKLLERKKNGETGVEEDYPFDVRAKSFVGTAEYVSPELLESKYCGKPGDLWAFGCILYQMIAGKPPFKATNEYLTFQKITKLQYAFSAGFPLILRDLIKQILVLQPSRRATIEQIQEHYFFHEYDFNDLHLIWNTDIPELSSYKMNAKSMMKIPTSYAPKKTVIKKFLKKPLNGSLTRIEKEESGTKSVSPASAAAYVLSKDSESEPPKSKTRTPKAIPQRKTTASSNATPDYIPGTNILRPQINKMASYSVSNSTSSSKTDQELLRRNSSRVIEVTPLTAVEAAWQQYLSPSERVINVGLAIVRRLPTEVFEKKNKGYIHDTPLGFTNLLQSSANRSNSRSMLSHVVQGNRLRDTQEEFMDSKPQNEDDAITYHFDDITIDTVSSHEEEEGKPVPVASGTVKLRKLFFKKLLSASDKKQESPNTPSTSGSSDFAIKQHVDPMDKVRTYTVLVSTFGRVLFFSRDDHKTDYKLVCEMGLNFPFIQFKEVVSSSTGKFSKVISSTGIFAIVSAKTTFVFETEKYEVSQWTEALAKSKLNQFHREKEAERKPSLSETPKSSPRLLDSPSFPSPTQKQIKKQESPIGTKGQLQKIQQSQSRSPASETRDNHMFKSNVKSKEKVKRKAPPSVPSSPVFSTGGLPSSALEHGESDMVHAAQIAVLNNLVSPKPDGRGSSFSRDKMGQGFGHPTTLSPGSGGAKITSLNSKFLARSRGKR
ncbi:kinase-like protein [Metschnikowia bicuspidata var. bicuspidata NRRL YB-4993]|uniref:non-specific serine/threonine protein kinase n=1 Tax=Metschnikowia bicuspidata var. bicuspidata NRRL YB-4993 TaxID=869754 RepID=A0A1A0H4V4_9ASCO|nr:kinase-like protein [Metschnikowia bicuspidata var. bicuspidata NRRL YB-4993]OBA19109.1 kinase-like protein [Metschnikowia bicuspidata var. bicuspidata NRRL YB-4993]